MTDSVAVFPAGFRLTDTEGVPYSGAVIRFYDSGTTTPKTVYADSDLTVELGTSVTCDSAGYPTSNGTTKTLIYTGTAAYKVSAETSAAVSIWSHDAVKGAVVASGGSVAASTYETIVETKTLNYTVVDADQSKILLTNPSSGDVTLTLPSAVTVGAGWRLRIDHAGTANQVKLASVSSQTLRRGGTSYGTMFSLAYQGEGVTLVSDGGNWVLTEYTQPFIGPCVGVITIADRLSAPPGSPADGALYILTSSPSGAWPSYAQHDVAQYVGNGWVKFTPTSDSGWLAFVQDEDIYYRFVGSAWVAESATTSTAGTVRLADATAMEAETAGRVVTADVQHRHPSAAKFWVMATVSGGTPSIARSYNVSSITDSGVGLLNVSINTDFSDQYFACVVTCDDSGSSARVGAISSRTSGAVTASCYNGTTLADPNSWSIIGFGDQ